MKTKLLFMVCAFFLMSSLKAQNPSFVWAHSFGSISSENVNKVLTDANGNVYIVGTFQNTVDFDPDPNSTFTLTALSGADVFFCKLDAAGNFVWAKSLGGPGAEYVYDMTLDASGNINATGSFSATTDFDPGPGIFNLTSSGHMDIFVLELTNAGNFVQAIKIGGTSLDSGRKIHCDGSDNVYITGLFYVVADFDPGPGTYTLSQANTGYSYIAKYDSNYNLIWAESWGRIIGSGGLFVNNAGIVTDAAQNVYITGCFGGGPSIDVATGAAVYAVSTGSTAFLGQNNRDIFLTKLTGSGNYCWTKIIGDTLDDEALNISITGTNICLSGYFQLTPDFDPGPSTFTLNSTGAEDIFVCKVDTAANLLWAKHMSGFGGEIAYDQALNGAGDIYLTGYFDGMFDADPGPGVLNLQSAGGTDVFIIRLDAAGNYIWSTAYGGASNESCRTMALQPGGGIYTGGTFSNTCDFDPLATNFSITSVGANDAYIHKIYSCMPLNLTANSSASVICAGGNAILSLNGANSYTLVSPTSSMNLWNPSVVIGPTVTTTYTIIGMDSNGCTNSISFSQIVSNCTGIYENIENTMTMNVYPNPFSGQFIIESDRNELIEILDLMGNVVFKKEIAIGKETVDLSEYHNGIYIVKFHNNVTRVVKTGN